MAIKYMIVHNFYINTYKYYLSIWNKQCYTIKSNLSECFIELHSKYTNAYDFL